MVVLCALVVLEMTHQLEGTILQLVEAHWGTLDSLSCITVVESTRKVQTRPTNLNTITAPNTQLHTHPFAEVFANYQWEASCSAWKLYASCTSSCTTDYLKQTGNRQYPTAFTVYPALKFMFT